MSRLLDTIKLAWRSLAMHKLRSGLTILGIVFGVASVITMIAVGEGTSKSAQESIENLGMLNIIINSVQKEDKSKPKKGPVEYGIKIEDVERIKATIPEIKKITLQLQYENTVSYLSNQEQSFITATDGNYFSIKRLQLVRGRAICGLDNERLKPVCVVSKTLAKKLLLFNDPLTLKLKFRGMFFDIVGISDEEEPKVYIPIRTALKRFGDIVISQTGNSRTTERVDYHQVILNMETREDVVSSNMNLQHLMKYGHKESDYDIKVPLSLLREAEATERMFNIVLGSISGISLLVGGIGIMNIMLASVSERKTEIGLRRALGAKQKDIIFQFMTESILLSLLGGAIGVLLGILLPYSISNIFDIETVMTPLSVILAFSISALVGIIFGSYPAICSARLNPITALRE